MRVDTHDNHGPQGPADTAELAARAIRGDAAAFAALIARHERTALAIAYARLHDPDAAGDVAQEAFLKAWQNIRSLDNPASFGGWLGQIVRNLAADALRSRQRRKDRGDQTVPPELADTHPAAAAAPPEEAARQETGETVDAALAQLDPISREIVTLRYFDGLASRDIAPIVGLSPAAVDMRLSRARQTLKDSLGAVLNP